MSKKAQVKKVYHYAKSDSGKKAAVGVGIAVLAIYALSKAGITDKIGGGISDAVGGFFEGIGDLISGAVKGGTQGAGWGAAEIGSAPIKAGVDLLYGEGKGDTYWNVGQEVIKKEGLGVLFWSKDKIAHYISPHSKSIEVPFYKTPSGRTYLTPEGQVFALQAAPLFEQWSAPGDVGYLMALREGRDVSRWNTSSLTPEFKRAMGIY